MSEKKWVNPLNLYLTIQSFGGTNKKPVHSLTPESGTQASTEKNSLQNHRHWTTRIYVF